MVVGLTIAFGVLVSGAGPASAQTPHEDMLIEPPGWTVLEKDEVDREDLEEMGIQFTGDGKAPGIRLMAINDATQQTLIVLVVKLGNNEAAAKTRDHALGDATGEAWTPTGLPGALAWDYTPPGTPIRVSGIVWTKGTATAMVAVGGPNGGDRALAQQFANEQHAKLPTFKSGPSIFVLGGGGAAALGILGFVVRLVLRAGKKKEPAADPLGPFTTGEPAWKSKVPAGAPVYNPVTRPDAARSGSTTTTTERRRAWYDTPLPPLPVAEEEPAPAKVIVPSRSAPVELPPDPDWWRKRRFEPVDTSVHRLNEATDPTPAPQPTTVARPVASAPIAVPRESPPIASTPSSTDGPRPQPWAPPREDTEGGTSASATARFAAAPRPPVESAPDPDRLAGMFDRLLSSADD